MALVPIAQPTVEPVTVDDLKAHLRVDGDDEATLVASLISAARVHLEQRLGLGFLTQSWTQIMDAWPSTGCIRLALNPLQNVDVVRVIADDEAVEVVAATAYVFDRSQSSARLAPRLGQCWPKPGRVLGGIEIDYTVGFGANPGDVPEPLRQAIRLLASHWFERRELVEVGRSVSPLPSTVEDLISPYRQVIV